MRIKFEYTLKTDGDYILRNADKFGCTDLDVNISGHHYDYVGSEEFVYDDAVRCRREATSFLAKFLCEGICVLFTEYSLVGLFYDRIDCLIKFIDEGNSGNKVEVLSGKYYGTELKITIDEKSYVQEKIVEERRDQLKTMHKFMTNSNDENLYMQWIAGGVPDCPSEDDFENIADDEELYTDCCNLFTALVQKNGWRYSGILKSMDLFGENINVKGE